VCLVYLVFLSVSEVRSLSWLSNIYAT
jgi:hypothetical protein